MKQADDEKLYLGLDIGGTKCAALLGTASGEVRERHEWPSQAERGPEAMLGDLLRHARSLPKAIAVGVSIGGPLDCQKGIVLSPPNLPGWNKFPLKDRLESELDLPVAVEHDAAACALAEYTWGGWQGCHCLLYLTCGTGFGAGIIIDGNVYHGAGGHSIELGHARFAEEGPEAFGKVGSNEAYCSGTGLGLLAKWMFSRDLTPRQIAEEAGKGDKEAGEVLQAHASATGQVCANLADTLFPNVILLGSLARHLGERWVDMVRARFEKEAHPHALKLCKLQPSNLGLRLQDLSAISVAINRTK